MKKVLSMILVLAMMLSLATVASVTSTAAEGATSTQPGVINEATGAAKPGTAIAIEDTDETVTDGNDVTYTVVRTADELTTALTTEGGGNYILANNVDLTATLAVVTGVVLNGNGYTLTVGASLTVAAGATVEFNNVVLNSTVPFIHGSTTPAKLSFIDCTKTGELSVTNQSSKGGYISEIYGGSIYFKNCINTGKITATESKGSNRGGFIGFVQTSGTVTFDQCRNEGEVYGGTSIHGGFIGQLKNATLSMTDCKNEAAINGTTKTAQIAGFIGNVTTTGNVTFERCTNSGTITSGTYHIGGFIGMVQNSTATISMTNCKNEGMIDGQTTALNVGGFIGVDSGNAPAVSFTNCENTATVKGNSYMGGFLGQWGVGSATFNNCVNRGAVQAVKDNVGGFVGLAKVATTFTNCVNAGVISGTSVGVWGGTGSTVTPTTTACANTVDDATEATAAPIYGGVQETAAANGVQKIRFLATVNSLNYHEVGFKVTVAINGETVKANGEDKVYSHAASYAYLTAKAGDKVETAKSLGGGAEDYIYTLTITDVPTTAGEIVFTIQTYVKNAADGEAILGAVQTVTYVNGEYQDPTAAN